MNILKHQLYSQYKTIRNGIVDLIRKSKSNHYQDYFSKNNKDLHKIWIGIKQIMNANSKAQ